MPTLPPYLGYYLPYASQKTAAPAGASYGGGGGTGSNPLTAQILDPNWGPAVYDTEKRGAELAVGGGYQGSPLAGYQTARMRAADIERRAALGDSLLSGETNRRLGAQSQANQASQFQQNFGQQEREFTERQRQFDERQRLDQERFDLERRQKQIASRGSYNPLPQYMGFGQRDGYSINRWTGGQPGNTWEKLY